MFTITRPAWNDRVQQGNLIVAAAAKVGMTPVTQLEFRWLDAPKTQPFVNPVTVDTAKSLKGYPIDQQVTRGHAGRWKCAHAPAARRCPDRGAFPCSSNCS